MRIWVMSAQSLAHQIWQRIREWCGDASYERYQRAMARKHEPLMLSPEQFYVQQLERKYSRPNRCC
jgi:uncharacterized short protein YbdD (DUF466 family)